MVGTGRFELPKLFGFASHPSRPFASALLFDPKRGADFTTHACMEVLAGDVVELELTTPRNRLEPTTLRLTVSLDPGKINTCRINSPKSVIEL